ncbi:hypothetical protein KGA66_17940 [Actinocrinis puniceicyclus]|uniref:Uncharacterized protein n=1 Tax=Actinocrinis puniceicyclus TaxID=977794 RepID=A0A8J8BD70_9ACTN|nr:hypothetical protein [Actinocrinis puniceicyclus]MBS2964943.1 hypothetical protein [Actinocrinis puniceicyclus]
MRPTCVEAVRLGCTVLWQPKAGSSEAEYEDAWHAPDGGTWAHALTVAVADGASESMLAGAWAADLARAVGALAGRDLDAGVFAERICAAAARWPVRVKRYIRRRQRAGRPLAWYEEAKVGQGAYATLLGVSFRSAEASVPEPPEHGGGGTWTAAALGDTCCFQVRGSALVAAFPVLSSADFDTGPHLAGTREPRRDLLEQRTVTRRGTWLPGDVFYLATDAAAQWFLAGFEAGRRPWRELDAAMSEPDPSRWLDTLRAERRIRNDDVTVLRCVPQMGMGMGMGMGTGTGTDAGTDAVAGTVAGTVTRARPGPVA